jgi:Tfp pilus assembly protein PilN
LCLLRVLVVSWLNGFIMKKAKDYINLLPREEKKTGRAVHKPVLFVALFVLVWLAIFGWQMKQAMDLRLRKEALFTKKQAIQQQLAAVHKELGLTVPAGSSPEKALLIQKILGERVLWSEVFKQFSFIVPKGLWFDSLEGSNVGKAELKIKGGAFSYVTVAEFMLAMEKSPYFEKPQLLFAQKAVVQGQDVVGFEIVCGIKKVQGAR